MNDGEIYAVLVQVFGSAKYVGNIWLWSPFDFRYLYGAYVSMQNLSNVYVHLQQIIKNVNNTHFDGEFIHEIIENDGKSKFKTTESIFLCFNRPSSTIIRYFCFCKD